MEATDEVGEDQYWIYTGEGEVPADATHVRVSDDVTVLPARAFSSRGRLVAVELNDGLVEIGKEAFRSCSLLKYVRIPSSVTTIGEWAFEDCRKLNHMEFPVDSRLDAIGKGAFYGSGSLAETKLPKSLSSLGDYAFRSCSRLTRVDLADTTLAAIEGYTFSMCTSLEDVRLPVTVERIGKHAFPQCTSLSNIILHEGVKTIGVSAFRGCKNLSINQLPSTVETIAASAFWECNLWRCNLRYFTSPLHCKELDITTFHGCQKLKSIQIVSDDTRLIGHQHHFRIPSLLRMNVPRSFDSDSGMALFRAGHFLSNISIAPDSTMFEDEYIQTFGEFYHSGCTLDRMKARFKRLPLHEICFDYSNQHTEVTFEQVLKCLAENVDALREKDCVGMTPLHIIACSTNHDVRLFQKLISNSHEALMDRDIFGRTALDYALLSDAPDEVFYLLFEPIVKMGDLSLNLELIDAAVKHNVPALQTWKIFSDLLERFFPAHDLDWEDLFADKVHHNSKLPIETYRWFARKAAKQRMIKMSTLTLTRQSKINEMIEGFQFRDEFPCGMQGYRQWRRQLGPVWTLMKRWELKEATVLLELALWKCRLDDPSVGSGSRVVARISCGEEIIISEVVQFLSRGDFESDIFGELFTLEDECEDESDDDWGDGHDEEEY